MTSANLACATIPAQSSIPLGYVFGTVLDLVFSTWLAVQRGGYIAQARDGRNFVIKGIRVDKSRIIYERCSLEAHSIMKRSLAEKGFYLIIELRNGDSK